jgi:YHS domain-containing protein
MKKIVVIIGVGILIAVVCNFVLAQDQNTQAAKQSAAAVNVGNKICPVSGDKINEKTKATYEYKGKIYNFCCSMCIAEFKKDPEKYIKKVEEELKSRAEAQKAPAAQNAPAPAGEQSGRMH